ncbi:hypothetical protein [Flavobacterium sp.]|uniref:hypothetical protein n=1 Tax=Flavobacterium sp. TaxID=239 RepID=UPI0022BAF3A6|nr:hypothetical protein [Flavobacterium sp.]MCZ8091639.1 hypothetical protein [Flavobacterium sp.]
MNKKIFIILILNLIFIEFVSSQNCDYEDYYKSIELAKKECENENFKEASKLYKIAFENTDFPFGTDLRNAFKVAEKTKDEIWMEQIAIKLAKGGIPLKYFKFFDKYKWSTRFYEQFPEYEKYFNENFDLEFRKTLVNVAKLDTETNSRFHEWRTRKEEHSVDTLVTEMTNVSLEFQKMIEKFGFPTEKKIGYFYNKGNINELPTFVLFVHIYQRGELLYKERLNELVCNGSLTQSQSKQLESTRGFGNSTGIVQEMEARKKKFRKNE